MDTSRRTVPVWALVAACWLPIAACIPTPPQTPRPARAVVPETFGGEDGRAPADGAAATTAPSSAEMDWQELFGDPHLVALIDLALEENQELNVAVQEMIVANSEVMARRGEIFPSLSAGLGAGVDRVGQHTSQGQSDEHLELSPDLPSFSLGLYASWEIDVWGRLRDSADAAMYRYLASAQGRNFMITRLVAEIATRYYELLALDRQLAILADNVRLQQDALEMMRLQQQAARVTMLAVIRFEAQLRGFQSRQYEVAQQILATENQINFLVGRFPQHVERSDADFLAITPPLVHAGIPARLVENRPDVHQAELRLAAAQLDVSAARARFYPSLSVDFGAGLQSFDIVQMFTSPGSLFYGLLGGLTAPLLNRSAITADYFAASSEQMAAVLRYERTILSAFVDISTGIGLVRNMGRAYDMRTQEVERLQESVELSTLLFNAARADYLEVLTTRRDYLEAQMELVETKQRQLAATVTLYQALGGGWRQREQRSDPEPMGAVP
ncbi:MAG: efflux transporter outer membrane subunit [Myxococcota bacterium]|nr:efflux transporter outer membrane subunit [Myxococcota bacterium]